MIRRGARLVTSRLVRTTVSSWRVAPAAAGRLWTPSSSPLLTMMGRRNFSRTVAPGMAIKTIDVSE